MGRIKNYYHDELERRRAVEDGMEPRNNPQHPMFRDHNCWKCREGERPCVAGNPNQCEFPHARND